MLGLHIATMRDKCHESRLVTEDHKSDLNFMVQTRGFTHCHGTVATCYGVLRLMARISGESLRTVTNTVPCFCDLLSAIAYCHALLQSTMNHHTPLRTPRIERDSWHSWKIF